MAKTIGIDLGTTNSVVAFIDGTKIETIPNAEGSKLTPSVVFYKESEVIVGELAKRQFMADPDHVIKSVKRVIGKRFSQITEEEQEDLPYKIKQLPDEMVGVNVGEGATLRPEEISADILDKIRDTAEDFLGEEITDVVITVPAHFNDQQRTATKEAAHMSGLNVLRIITEPTAAALAYGQGQHKNGIVAVFDFGGGTFDISILNIHNDIYEVISTNGDNCLGGDDVDQRLFQELCDQILQQTSIDPTQNTSSVQRIREATEKAKHDLSQMTTTTISLPFIVADSSGPKHFEIDYTRDQFNALMQPLFERLFEPCRKALEDADLSPNSIDEVVMVGGSTRIPKVQLMVEEYFGRKPNASINPDEAIAVGAAIQSGVITGDIKEVLLLDVIPLTLGIELAGGVYKPMIERNSTIPSHASRKFTTVVDNQKSIRVRVLQGERRIASENHFLAEFRLLDVPPAPKELPEIEVHFSVDANGILSVTAVDLSTGAQTDVSVENYGNIGVSEHEVERRVKDAEENIEADEEFIRFSESRNMVLLLQRRVDKIFEFGAEFILEQHARTLKESVFKLDIALDKYDMVSIQNLKNVIQDLLIDYESHPDIERQLRINETVDESIMDSSSDEVPRISTAYTHPESSDFADIEAELSNLMQESEKLLPQEEVNAKTSKTDVISANLVDLSEDEPDDATSQIEEPNEQSDGKPIDHEGSPPASEKEVPKATPKATPKNAAPKKSFAFAPPKIEEVDNQESEFDLENAPPPPPE